MAAEDVQYEKSAEMNEGLAQYAGVKAVMFGIETQRRDGLDLAIEEPTPEIWRSKRLASLSKMEERRSQPSLCLYASGAAQAFLLDTLAPGWKGRVQNEDVSLQDLLGQAMEEPGTDDAAIAEEARRAGGFDGLLAGILAADEKIKEKNRALVDSILPGDGRKIVVDLKAWGRLASQFSFDPNKVVVVDPDRRVFLALFRPSEERSYAASFGKPVLADKAGLRYHSQTNTGERPALIVDGKPLSLDRPGHIEVKKQAVLQADEISITLEAGAVVSIEGRIVLLRPAPPVSRAGDPSLGSSSIQL